MGVNYRNYRFAPGLPPGRLLVRIHFIIEMIWWTGLAPWEFEFPFPGSLTSTFLSLTSRAAEEEEEEARVAAEET